MWFNRDSSYQSSLAKGRVMAEDQRRREIISTTKDGLSLRQKLWPKLTGEK